MFGQDRKTLRPDEQCLPESEKRDNPNAARDACGGGLLAAKVTEQGYRRCERQRVDELPGAERHIPKEWLVDIAANIAKVPNVALFRDKPSVYKKLKRAYRTGKKEI